MLFGRTPIHDLPDGYREDRHISATDWEVLMRLARWSLVPLVIALAGMLAWAFVARDLRGNLDFGGVGFIPGVALAVLGLLLILPLHEAVHGVAILLMGHRPRFGAKLEYGMLYATADNALFRRGEFILIALAPLVVLTPLILYLTLVWPGYLYIPLTIAMVTNASGAIADLWMAWVVMRYPPDILVRDEADSIRIFVHEAEGIEARLP